MFNNALRGYGKKVKGQPILGEPAGLAQTQPSVPKKSGLPLVWLGVPLAAPRTKSSSKPKVQRI